jgi:ubiquinone/menaquinone biosynthesis C-methylase UbiE
LATCLLSLLSLLNLTGSLLAAEQQAPRSPRVFNPKNAELLEEPSRDGWQKPTQVVPALKLEPGDVVADIGTGSGYFVPYLSAAVGPSGLVLAVDIQPEMLAFVERKVGELGLTNVITVLSQEADTRLEPESVDLVLMVDVYHELGSPSSLLSNIRSALKLGGRFAIIDFKRHKEAAEIGPPLNHRVPQERVISELKRAGFELVERLSILPYQYFLVFSRTNGAASLTGHESTGNAPQ